jgi:hypothetical protein
LGKVVEEELIAALRESPLFSALKPEELSAVAEIAKLQSFDPNQFIVDEGDVAKAFYLILDGLVEVRREDRPFTRLARGQFFGETTIVGNMSRSDGVLAVRKTRCIVLSGSELRSYPAVALKLMSESTRRAQTTTPQPPAAAHAKPLLPITETTIEFGSKRAKLLFDNLVKSFTQDYMVRRLYFEQAGWRTFSELAKTTRIPRTTLYGVHGNYGAMMNELLARGLIETRVFTGQRGRGGEVLRVRIAYDKEPVKRYVDYAVLKRKSDKQLR